MAQQSQQDFFERMKNSEKFAKYFNNVIVLDVGSLDINGNNKVYFDETSDYIGLDVGEGKNVNIISFAHEFKPSEIVSYNHYFSLENHLRTTEYLQSLDDVNLDQIFDTIISSEAFEHDPFLPDSLNNIVNVLLKKNGLFLFTCATTGQAEHGTVETSPDDCPLMIKKGHNYYKNLVEADIRAILNIEETFSEFEFKTVGASLQFWGVKK